MAYTLSVTLPIDWIHLTEEFCTGTALVEMAQTAEKAGFWSVSVTDHPIPGYRWLDAGGHYAQDPFVMLSMAAAVTTKLRLQTNIIVLPYRNPFITARAVSSLDAFSNGRFVFGMGAGYLKPEYKALGVDFDSRNDLMDPPLLIGGNSKRALRRTVEHGDAWHPFIVPKMVTDTARTAAISGEEDLVAAMDYMAEHSAKIGRATPPQVICSSTVQIKRGFSAQEALDSYASFHRIGVAGSGAGVQAETRSEWCDLVLQFGEEVIARLD